MPPRVSPRTRAHLLFAAAVLPLASPRSQEPVPATAAVVDQAILDAAFAPTADELMAHVRFLASAELRGRRAGSPEGKLAADHIAAAFAAAGLQPAGDDGTFRQSFPMVRMIGKANEAGELVVERQETEGANVLGWIEGTDKDADYILVGAHYDHLGARGDTVFHGADDNASGTAGLLGIAQAFAVAERRPRHSILLVAFDGEEDGLRGAEHFVRHPVRTLQQLFTMVNLDMIGRGKLFDREEMVLPKRLMRVPDGPALGVLGFGSSPDLEPLVRAVFREEQLPLFAPKDFGMLAKVIEKQADGRADHAPFERRKIPFLFFSNSEHDDYHQPTDTASTIDQDALHRATRAIYRTLLAIDTLEEKPRFVPESEREDSDRDDR